MTVPMLMMLSCAPAPNHARGAPRTPRTRRARLNGPRPVPLSLVVFVYYTCYSKGSKPDKNASKARPHGADDLASTKFE